MSEAVVGSIDQVVADPGLFESDPRSFAVVEQPSENVQNRCVDTGDALAIEHKPSHLTRGAVDGPSDTTAHVGRAHDEEPAVQPELGDRRLVVGSDRHSSRLVRPPTRSGRARRDGRASVDGWSDHGPVKTPEPVVTLSRALLGHPLGLRCRSDRSLTMASRPHWPTCWRSRTSRTSPRGRR